MSSLKNQQRKLLTREITAKVMEYFRGLNKKNKLFMTLMVEKSSKKLAGAYCDAIKSQHKKVSKATRKVKGKDSTVPAPVIHNEQTTSRAS
jgi:hypothetical protein